MDYQQRMFHNDLNNGLLEAGYLDPETAPEHFDNMVSSYYRCSLVLSGSGRFTDSAGNEYSLHSGSVYQLLPGQTFHLTIDSDIPWLEYRICINSATYQSLMSLQLLSSSPTFTIELKAYLLQWLPVLLEELKNRPQKELSEVFFNTQKLLIQIHKEYIEYSASDSNVVVECAKQILSSSCHNDISLTGIADNFNMSYEKFRKLFKEGTGQSPLQFQLTVKFRYAQRFLTEGFSIKETAQKVGYADPYIFSKQFKKYVGQTPSQYIAVGRTTDS
jgi:AraC-like DNA-binding protein